GAADQEQREEQPAEYRGHGKCTGGSGAQRAWLSGQWAVVFSAPQRTQRYCVTRRPAFTSKRFSVTTSHLWKPLLHRVRCLPRAASDGLLNGSTSPMIRNLQH